MKRTILFLSLFATFSIFSVEKMDTSFQVHYGNPQAPLKVIEYFSFSCPHCVKLFREFSKIKTDFIDTNYIYFTFQPVPKEVSTLRALHCFEILNEKEKQLFLEAMFEYLDNASNSNEEVCHAMQELIGCLGKDKLPINEMEYLKESPIMEKAFNFISQKEQVNALPTAEINGLLFLNEVPNHAFFFEAVGAILGEKK